MEQELTAIGGTVENIVFHNANNGWTVFELDCGGELVTAVGVVLQIAPGDGIRLRGEWVNHPSYGRQFKIQSFEKSLPATEGAMLKYLSSGAVKGIGPSTAARIVEAFGEDTLRVIEQEPQKLTQVRGISLKKALAVCEDYKRQFGVRSAMLFLQQYGVTPAESVRIWQRMGPTAVDAIRQNPYVLCESGVYISFERADAIAAEMGFEADSAFRIRAGLIHILRHNLGSSGHTFIPCEKLTAAAAALLHVEPRAAQEQLEGLCADETLARAPVSGRDAVFLPEAFRAESYAAGRLRLMLELPRPALGDVKLRVAQAEERFGIRYAEKQKEAIAAAVQSGAMILTGGPGTGKTTAINAIIAVFEGMGLHVALAAPTGRAAKRMAEVTGREAKTIHRLLEVEYTENDTPHFGRNEKNQLECDALIVDELSMVDVFLFESLLRALRLQCRLVLVGDADQLPPVGPGNALRDMLESGVLPSVRLEQVFRQAAQSLIVRNAHAIVRGEQPDLSQRGGNFFFLPRYTPAQVRSTVTDLALRRLPDAYGFSPLWDLQVLVPGRRGELGANELNTALQAALNPPSPERPERAVGGRVFRQGDKVMQTRNNYDVAWTKDDGEQGAGVFNGDVGLLEALDRRTGAMRIRFDDRVAELGPECVDELDLAYAVTVHKSQGCEFKAVVLPLFSGAPQLFYRNLLYTAVTRARELVVVVGREETVQRMVENGRKTLRYTALCSFLRGGG